jgi:hypothetical protein
MVAKIKVKEAFGVNANIVLCHETDCVTSSVHLGTSQLLFTTLRKGLTYSIEIYYTNSIISMSTFFSCPHISIEVSMIAEHEAKTLAEQLTCQKINEQMSEEKLNNIFNSLVRNT